MKTTAERLSDVYCRPKTEDEWVRFTVSRFTSLGDRSTYVYFYNDPDLDSSSRIKSDTWLPNGMTEIPVSHFLDLLHDRIVPWRLEEDGFENQGTQLIGLFGSSHVHYTKSNGWVAVTPFDGLKGINVYLRTYTDMLTLCRLLTPTC